MCPLSFGFKYALRHDGAQDIQSTFFTPAPDLCC